MDLSAEICGKFPFSASFLRPQGAILYYILSSLCLPVGWWDCLLGALKAHKETSAHDYQGWLQARPIREDIKKYFDLVLSQNVLVWIFIRIVAKIIKIYAENRGESLLKKRR